jgi:parallel beta-helix repeat protein
MGSVSRQDRKLEERAALTSLVLLVSAVLVGCSDSSDGGMMGPGSQLYVVGPSGSADYASIQQAVDEAPAGSTIVVQAGSYDERVEIRKSLTLSGSGPGTLVSLPSGGQGDSAVIEIRDASGVRIETLSVRAAEPDVDGIRIRDAANVVLDRIVASSNGEDGVDIRASSKVEILSGTFEQNVKDGVQVDEGSNDVRIISVQVASNGEDGIKIRNSSNVLVQDSTANFNGDDGILVRDSNGVEITGCTAMTNQGWGITVNFSPDTALDQNTVQGNGAGEVECEPDPCTPPP